MGSLTMVLVPWQRAHEYKQVCVYSNMCLMPGVSLQWETLGKRGCDPRGCGPAAEQARAPARGDPESSKKCARTRLNHHWQAASG